MNIEKPRGMAGTILVILIFGLLVSISTAYIKMVQTETQVQGMIDNSDRALDAAFAGVNANIAILQAQKDKPVFENDVGTAAKRIYFVPSVATWGGIGLTYGGTYSNATGSDWIFIDDKLSLFDYGETGSSTKPYQFRLHSYPGTIGSTIQPGSYTIKAQGRFLVYATDQTTVVATYSSQIIAECEIKFNNKVIQIKRWRYMPFEGDDPSFGQAIRY